MKPGFEDVTFAMLDECDRLLMPDRHVEQFVVSFPFSGGCNFDEVDEFLANELQPHADSAGLMLVHPEMTAEDVEAR
ncbi:MAG: hypothetical protein R3C02_04780 [Planctomycetaceae bacterium]